MPLCEIVIGNCSTIINNHNEAPKVRTLSAKLLQSQIKRTSNLLAILMKIARPMKMVHGNAVFIREESKLARNTHRYTFSTRNFTSFNSLNFPELNRLIAEDTNTRQLRKSDNRGGRENASKMRLRFYFALQLCGVKEATNHNCRRFYIVVSVF